MISVTMTAADTYEVVVGPARRVQEGAEKASETHHQVTLSAECYQRLSGGAFTHEWVLVQVFRLLLERRRQHPAEAEIPERLDVAELEARLPDFAADVAKRLGR